MIRMFSILALAAAVGFAFSPLIESVSVDTNESVIEWTGYKVTGKHNGTLKLKEGNLMMEGGELVGGDFTIDMTSINVSDLEGEYKGKLEGHLKSDDFFGVANHPTAKFTINKVISRGKPGDYRIDGEVTIKDITKPVKFNTLMSEENGRKVATADITLDRTEFNVRYGSGSFFDNLGDKTIYDEFDITVKLVAGK